MKLYHFSLFFLVVALGFFMTAQIQTVVKLQEEGIERMEYDCLVAAVNAAVEVAFYGEETIVTAEGLKQAEEVFFQTLAVIQEGSTDRAGWEAQKEKVPLLVVFDEEGYYQYCYNREGESGWSTQKVYEEGKIPDAFFEEAEALLTQVYNGKYRSQKKYGMVQAQEGVWEKSITPPLRVCGVSALRRSCVAQRKKLFICFVGQDNRDISGDG